MRVRDEARLGKAIVAALRHIREGARTQMPETGAFSLLQAHFDGNPFLEGAGNVELRIGPASLNAGERERFLEVRVSTPSGGSESSVWLYYGTSSDLRRALQDEAPLIRKIQTAIMEGVQSLLRHELP